MHFKFPIVLASGSPRRKQLLEELGLTFEVLVRPVSELFPDDLHPRAVAVLIAENKAKAYLDLPGNKVVITADTLVVVDNEILGKPADEAEAVAMLKKLSAKTHQVITGVTISHEGKFKSFVEETQVTFRNLQDEEIRHYVARYKPYDKAGGYAIQEWIGQIGITRIEGDYYNVVGLPVSRLYQELGMLD
jgi:septum formation protein